MAMDLQYLLLLQRFREITSNLFSDFLLTITKLGEDILPVLLVLVIYWCVNKKIGVRALFSTTLSVFLNGILKLIFCVYRPWIRSAEIQPYGDAKVTATGYSFPSGHSMNSAGAYGMLAKKTFREYRAVSVILMAAIALVMFSRNYLGVHTPQDVLVGCAAAVLCVFAADALMNWVEKKDSRDWLLLICAYVAVAAALLFFLTKSYPMDYTESGAILVDPVRMQRDSFDCAARMLGFLTGWFIERRFVNFTMEVSARIRITRGALGALIFVLIYRTNRVLFPILIPEPRLAFFAASFLTYFVCTAVYPMCFSAIEKRSAARARAAQA